MDSKTVAEQFPCFPKEVMENLRESAAKTIAYFTFPGLSFILIFHILLL